ncbi:hypothetical protein AUG86_02295 [Euryarchaeota archaeon 13_1_20CM_4_64_14]|nr:MAG: hypothetical protein AUG86_02295 [Euryarchaeota archaeon 13_1_20CM_4_64_14]
MGVVEAAVLALAVLFYAVTIYHVTLIFIGLRLTADRGKPFDKGSLRNPVDLPKVSILIPAKDEEVVIEGAILCANRLDYPKDLLEIIVVEDGSKDETPTIGKRMASLVPNVVCVSGGESKGKPAALNRAFANATGDLIAIFDSDTRYGPDLLLRAVKHLHDHPEIDVAQAFPQVMNAETNVITRINYYETRFWFQGLQSAKDRYGLFMHLAGTGMFIRRRALQALGPWDESCLTEDLDYSLRLARSGGKVGMVDADIWIQPTYRARHLVRQRQRWWGGALLVDRAVWLIRRRDGELDGLDLRNHRHESHPHPPDRGRGGHDPTKEAALAHPRAVLLLVPSTRFVCVDCLQTRLLAEGRRLAADTEDAGRLDETWLAK